MALSLPNKPIFNYPNNKLYQYEAYPVLLSCQFTVAPADAGGLGITSLKGSGIANVFMHTSVSPGTGNYSQVNPNPADGIIKVQLTNNFNKCLSVLHSVIAPNSGTPLTAVTAGLTYVITSLGTATVAQWVAKGVPVGMTPAVGLAFVATATGTIGGSAQVQVPISAGIDSIELVGNPNSSLQNSNLYLNLGGQLILQSLLSGARTAANVGSVISLNFYLSNSSVQVNGQ